MVDGLDRTDTMIENMQGQLTSMVNQEKAMQGQLNAMERQEETMRSTLDQSKRQLEAMERQIKLMAVSERAEIAIKNIIKTNLKIGFRPEVNILFHNGGKTAARNVALNGYLFVGYGYRGEVTWETPPPKTGGAGSVIAANMDSLIRVIGYSVFTEEELGAMRIKEGERARLFLFAEMHYIDFLDERQIVPFQMVYNQDSDTWDNYYGQEEFYEGPN